MLRKKMMVNNQPVQCSIPTTVYLQTILTWQCWQNNSNFNPSKAHGLDNISIWMIKICGLTTCKPLGIIFKETAVFPVE